MIDSCRGYVRLKVEEQMMNRVMVGTIFLAALCGAMLFTTIAHAEPEAFPDAPLLKGLGCATITVNLNVKDMKFGYTPPRDLQNLDAYLKSELWRAAPKIQTGLIRDRFDCASEWVYLMATITVAHYGSSGASFYGMVHLEAMRFVVAAQPLWRSETDLKLPDHHLATVWSGSFAMAGPTSGVVDAVQQVIQRLAHDFARVYYQANSN